MTSGCITGKDLIMYILENDLENDLFFDNKRVGRELLGFMSVMEAAIEFGVGTSTVLLWYERGSIKGFKIGETVFILANQKNPMEEGKNA